MKYLALLFIAAAALAGGASARETGPLLRYQLDNGLDVILVPDHRVPKVVVDIGYRVGAVNEPPGRSGFAHLFEHLMFMGTPAYPDIDAAYGAVGADINASTWNDYTIYYTRGLSSALPYMLAVEADRMANQGAAISAEDLDLQRDVVLNEMRQNTLDTLNGAAMVVAQAQIYPAGHPYSRTVIGSMADLAKATIADVHGFFDTFYVPNNAVLTLVGDFDPDEAKALIADTFGRISRGATPPSFAVPDVTPQRARAELVDRVPTPRLFLSWPTAPLRDPQSSLLRLTEQLLGNDEYGVLRRELVDAGIADNAWAYLWGGGIGSQFIVEVSAAPGVDMATVEAATRKALAGYLAVLPDAAEVTSERQKIILGDRVANEDPLTFADNILTYTMTADDPFFALHDDPYVAAATPESVIAAARGNLQPDEASVVVVHPGERGDYPAVLTASTGTAEPFAAASRPHVDVPALQPTEPVAAPLPEAQTATLSNGIEIVHYDMPDAPMAFLGARSAAGTLSDPEGREGMIELAAVMGTNGAGERGPAAFGKAATDLGATFGVQLDVWSTFINIQMPAENFAPAVALLGDALQRPRFDQAEWNTVMAKTLSALAERESDVADVASRYALASLLPKLPGQPAIDSSVASTSAVTRDDALAIYRRVFSPRTVTFYSVGPVPLDAVVAALEATFGNWQSDAEPLPPAQQRPVTIPHGRRVLLVPEPGATQSAIYIATPAPGYTEAGSAESFAVVRVLGEDFISRINSVIREDLGYTYGTGGKLLDFVRSETAMVIEAPVTREHTGDALAEMLKGYASLAVEPVREDELERTITAIYSDMAGTAETTQGLFDAIWGAMVAGSTLEEQHRLRLAVTALDLDEVRKRARAMADTDNALIVVVGDEAVVRPQLDALGLDVEVVERNL